MRAGPLLCPLYEPSADQIHARVEKLLKQVQTQPVAFYDNITSTYGQVDYASTKTAMLVMLYNAPTFGRELMKALYELESGDPRKIHDMSSRTGLVEALTHYTCTCPAIPIVPFAQGGFNQFAIICGDAIPNRESPEQLKEVYDEMYQMSIFADAWLIHMACS